MQHSPATGHLNQSCNIAAQICRTYRSSDSSNLCTQTQSTTEAHTEMQTNTAEDGFCVSLFTHAAVGAGPQRPVCRVWEALRCERELIQNWWLLTMSAKQDNVPFSSHSLYMRLKRWSSRQRERVQGKPTDRWEAVWGKLGGQSKTFVWSLFFPTGWENQNSSPFFFFRLIFWLQAKIKELVTGRFLLRHDSRSKDLVKVPFNELELSFLSFCYDCNQFLLSSSFKTTHF